MVQIHKRFTDEQVKELIEKCLRKEVTRNYLQEILAIGKCWRRWIIIQKWRWLFRRGKGVIHSPAAAAHHEQGSRRAVGNPRQCSHMWKMHVIHIHRLPQKMMHKMTVDNVRSKTIVVKEKKLRRNNRNSKKQFFNGSLLIFKQFTFKF